MFRESNFAMVAAGLNQFIADRQDADVCLTVLVNLFLFNQLPAKGSPQLIFVQRELQDHHGDAVRTLIVKAMQRLLTEKNALPSATNTVNFHHNIHLSRLTAAQILVLGLQNQHLFQPKFALTSVQELHLLTPTQWLALGHMLRMTGVHELDLSANNLYRLTSEQWVSAGEAFNIAHITWLGLSLNGLHMLLPNNKVSPHLQMALDIADNPSKPHRLQAMITALKSTQTNIEFCHPTTPENRDQLISTYYNQQKLPRESHSIPIRASR